MVHKAAVVNLENQMLVYASSKDFSRPGLEKSTYSAVDEVFNRARKSDIRGGVLFTDRFPSEKEARAILSARVVKVVSQKPAITVKDVIALQLLEEEKIEVIYNPEIILEPED